MAKLATVCIWLHVIEGTEKNIFRGEAAQAGKQVNCTGKSLPFNEAEMFLLQLSCICSFTPDTVHFGLEISIK